MLKLDKTKRIRTLPPVFFFFRRFLTSLMLSVPLDSKIIFLQYVVIVMISHIWLIYLYTMKPYQCPLLNNFQVCSETLYVILCISTLIFSDSEPDLGIKLLASLVLFTTVVMLIFNNFLLVIILLYKGKAELKSEIDVYVKRR